jgi:glutamyl-tRNA synthetase
MTIRTRFAPSPTGMLHIGGVRTALFCWLYARRHGGVFILRVEDTDRERSTDEAVQVILDGMEWVGLKADEGPFYQTRRTDRYTATLERMLTEGTAYRCYCTREELDEMRKAQQARKEKPRYDGRCRDLKQPREGMPSVVRFRNPADGAVTVNDIIHGPIVFQNRELDDLIIARTDGTPTYNFCVVVDDVDMRITHVIRGDDHINNTPRQINIFKALGTEPPVYAHLPMILGPDGAKLSKRHGAVSVLEYREQGYLPEALLNYLARLGWSHGDQEVFSMEEMAVLFDLADVNKSAAAINPDKLNWLNQQHMLKAPAARLALLLQEYLEKSGIHATDLNQLEGIVAIQRERARTFVEMAQLSRFFFEAPSAYDEKAVAKNIKPETSGLLAKFRDRLNSLASWDAPSIHLALETLCKEADVGMGKLAQPVRIAVSGGAVSPPIDATLALLGKAEAISRIDAAVERILPKT